MQNIAVVGLGYWGPNLVRNTLSQTNANLAAVCDLNPDTFKKLKYLPEKTNKLTNIEDILNDESINIVIIATPTPTHYELAKQCLEAGKHVLVEKPLTLREEESLDLIVLAAEKGLKLGVGHTFLYTAAVEKMKEIIDSEEIGNILHIHSHRLNLGLFQRDTNVIWDLFPHDVSIILHILNSKLPDRVFAHANSHYSKGVEDTALAVLNFNNSVSAYLYASWIDPNKVRKFTVVGDKKMIVFDDIELTEKIKVYDRGFEQPYQDYPGFLTAYRYGDIRIPKIGDGEALHKELAHFISCVESGGDILTDGNNGYRVVRALNMIQDAADSDRSSKEQEAYKSYGNIRDVELGEGIKIWQPKLVNLYECKIGDYTSIGAFVEIQKRAYVGKNCKISSNSFICEGVNIEDNVFIGHNVTFTNDKYPRSTNPDGTKITDKDWTPIPTYVKGGASIGSGSTILPGVTIGENSLIGAGSVVTKDIPQNTIAYGNPAKVIKIIH